MFGFSTAKLIGAGIGLIAVLGFVFLALSWRSERNSLRDWQAVTVAATREAAGEPRLKARDVPAQIRALGDGLRSMRRAVDAQNLAIDALAKHTAEQQRNAAQASQEARQRAKGAEDVSADLRASSRAPERAARPCEPSKALQEAWK